MKYIKFTQRIFLFFLLSLLSLNILTQSIYYSNPKYELDSYEDSDYFIIGRVSSSILILKKNKKAVYINIYDEKMGIISSFKFNELNDETIEIIEAINCIDNTILFFRKQLQYSYILYSIALSANGVPISDLIVLDTFYTNTMVNFSVSDNKRFISCFTKNEVRSIFECKQIVLNNDVQVIKTQSFNIEKNYENEKSLLYLNNEGDSYFISYYLSKLGNSDMKAQLIIMPLNSGEIFKKTINIPEEVSIQKLNFKINNQLNNALIYGLVCLEKNKKSVGGIYNINFNIKTNKFDNEYVTKFSSDVPANLTAIYLDDINVNDLIFCKDSSIILFMEENQVTTITESNNPNITFIPNYAMGMSIPINISTTTIYTSGDIFIVKIKKGQIIYSTRVFKRQKSKNSDLPNSFYISNRGNELNIYYNNFMANGDIILNSEKFYPYGEIKKIPISSKLKKNYTIYIKHAKQIDKNCLIAPCVINDILCFSKISF